MPMRYASRSTVSWRASRCSARVRGSTPISVVAPHHSTSARAKSWRSDGTWEPCSQATTRSGWTGVPQAAIEWATWAAVRPMRARADRASAGENGVLYTYETPRNTLGRSAPEGRRIDG